MVIYILFRLIPRKMIVMWDLLTTGITFSAENARPTAHFITLFECR